MEWKGKLSETEINCLKLLLAKKCCFRCALRIISYKDVAIYRETNYSEFIKTLSVEFPGKIYKDSFHIFDTPEGDGVCTVCFGILQHCDKGMLLEAIVTTLKNTEYEYTDYKFKVKLPHILILFQYQIMYEIAIENPSIYHYVCMLEKKVIPSKDVLKWIMSTPTIKATGIQVNLKSDFFLYIKIDYSTEENPICQEVMSYLSAKIKNKSKKEIAGVCGKKLIDGIKVIGAQRYVIYQDYFIV